MPTLLDARPRVRITRRLPSAVEQAMKARFDVVVSTDDAPVSPSELAEAFESFDVLCTTITDRLDATLLARASHPRVRLIANYGAGVNHIDVPAAQAMGIAVTNTPDAVTDATADLTLMLMLMVTRRAGEGERELRAGRWTGWRPTHMMGADLRGKTLGLLGFGRIARAVAARVRPLGMKVVYLRRSTDDGAEEARRVESLDELLAISDVLSLHAPGTPATHHIVDAGALARMRPGGFLVNTARGSLVDEAALVEALHAGRIAGAALDVYENEPEVHPGLVPLENVVLLPHLGSATLPTREAMGMRMLQNVEAFCAGERPRDLVT